MNSVLRLTRFFLILAAVLVVGYFLRGVLLPPVARFLDVSSVRALPVDYVLPPPGDDNTRTLAAAALVRHGYAEKVAILQGAASPREMDGIIPSSAEITRRVLLARGIEEHQIVPLRGITASTLDDMRLLSGLWENSPDARVAIVSNGYHLRRLRWSVRRVLPEQASRVSYIAAPLEDFDESDWWQSEQGLSSVLSEYAKISFYILKYGSAGQRALFLGPILIGFVLIAAWIARRVHRRRDASLELDGLEM